MQLIIAKRLLPSLLLLTMSLFNSSAYGQQTSGENNNETGNRAANLIVTLEHRSALRAIERLTPLLDPRGDIGRIADKLVINTTAANLPELENELAAFDVPARRLVLSIDPSFSPEETSNDRQSMQALELETNIFVLPSATASTNSNENADAEADEEPLEAGEPSSTLSIEAEIIGSVAHAQIQTSGMDSLLPTYRISMPLGQWVTLAPARTEANPVNSEQQTLSGEQESTDATVSAQTDQQMADFAVRVDVLP